jgi:imidazolonepropionase-like amidohydrolase
MRTLCLLFATAMDAFAQRPSQSLRPFIAIDTPVVVIRNVRVIDGTGAPARDGQTIVIRDGKIVFADSALPKLTSNPAPQVIDGTGKTVIPGLVMVHEHLFYPSNELATYLEHPYTFPRLYLGEGITTARTGGSLSPIADLKVKQWIDAGQIAGPSLDVTGPYLNGENPFPQMYSLKDSADARRFVRYWADMGATSFKAYMQITRDQLRAAIDEAHKRGLKVTGHLCSVTYREAAELGIDNLEHGLVASTDLAAGKRPDVCPSQGAALANIDPATDSVMRSVIRTLVDRNVALTSTLAIFESFTPGRPETPQRVLDAMGSDARKRFTDRRALIAASTASPWAKAFKNAMMLEKMFVDAGGTLLVGTDPTGYGGVLPGFGSQRTIELLVEGGFTPVQAIKIATLNGAMYLGRADRIGTIAVGKQADLVLIAGDPGTQIADIEKVEIVFKRGVGYDSTKLLATARGAVGSD